jgi:hypothetical protein
MEPKEEIKKKIADLLKGQNSKSLDLDESTFATLKSWTETEKDKTEIDIETWAKPKNQKKANEGLQIAANQNDPDKQIR